jgi:hypothetical protein
MVLAALGTIGVAAWMSLLDARGHQVEANISALERRTIYNNSKALAYRAIYANHLHTNTTPGSDTTYALPEGLGQCTIRSYSDIPLENASATRTSKNGALPLQSYTTDLTVDIPDGVGTSPWSYQMRSYNPMLGGELLSVHPAADFSSSDSLISGNLIVEGRVMLWDVLAKDLSAGFSADEFLLPNEMLGTTTLSDSSGNATLPLNYPISLQTTGFYSAGSPYEGGMEIFDPSPNPHNSYFQRIISSGGYEIVDGKSKKARGKGPANKPPKDTDDAAKQEIATKTPQELINDLKKYGDLSSEVLLETLRKADPPFNENQLLQLFKFQSTIPTDVLTELMSTYEANIGLSADDLNEDKKTYYATNAKGKVHLFLGRSDMPSLILRNVTHLRIFGQGNGTDATLAESMDPITILVINDDTTLLTEIEFFHRNSRRIALVLASSPTAPSTAQISYQGTGSFPEWHCFIEFVNTSAEFDTSAKSAATIFGGIRTNSRIDVKSGTLRLKQEFDPRGIESLLSRNAWVEAYKQ